MLEVIYGTFVIDELKKLIPDGSFASCLNESIGRELQGTIEALDEEDEKGFWGTFPVQELYELLASGWNLDHEWFQYTDGVYRDDNENEIPLSIPRSYTAVEQIAAYGLYWIRDNINACGQLPDEGYNDQGWTREGIIEHKAECLLRAYQALVYGQKLMIGNQIVSPATQEEIEKAARIAMARRAADALHNGPKGFRVKRKTIQEIWASGKYSSRDICAEQECAALEMSFSTARKALRGTPDTI
ncbi:MAG: hypothetical protein WC091_04385 [Sulfuricellaceae bacterium]